MVSGLQTLCDRMRGMSQQPSKATISKGRAIEITDRDWYFHVWLSLLISLASSATALTALLTPAHAIARVLDAEASETPPEQVLVETAEPRAILAQAQRWRERGTPFPIRDYLPRSNPRTRVIKKRSIASAFSNPPH